MLVRLPPPLSDERDRQSRSSMAHPMKRHLILLLIFYILLPTSAPQAQNEDVLTREGDENAITTEERQRTLETLLTAARQLRDTGELLQAARLLNRAGRLRLQLNSAQDAIVTYQDALTILKRTPDPTINVDSLNGLGAAYNHKSQCDKAQQCLQQAITLSEQNGYIVGKAEALLTLSDCQNYSNHALALRTAQEALELWQSINRKRGIAKSYTVIGGYQMTQNMLTEATQSLEAALIIWRELNVTDEQAEALINLGYIEYRKGAWQNVFMFLTQAQDLFDEKAEPHKMGEINAGLAEAFIESGLPEIGLTKYFQALEDYRQTQIPQPVIAMIFGIGRTHYVLGNYQQAIANLQHALTEAEFIKERKVAALCNEFLGRTFGAMNNPTVALRYFEVSLNLFRQTACPMEAARVQALMGQIYQQQGKVAQARTSYKRALKTFHALADQVNQSATLYALGSLELQQPNLNVAEDYLRQSIEVTENMRRVSTSRDLTAAFSITVHERYEKYIECLMHKHNSQPAQGFAVQAFETCELARGRSLAELLRATGTNLVSDLDPQLAAQEKSLRQLLRVKEDYKVALLGRAYQKEELDALDAELAKLQEEYKQVNETIRSRYPAYEQITKPASWDLRKIQEQVIADDQTLLLEYSLGTDKSYVWAVTRDSIKSYALPSRVLINDAAQNVYKLLASPPDSNRANDLKLALEELSRMVLSPVAAELNKQRIIIVADGALHYIPFQVLPAPSADKEPLVANHEIINTPSASILGELRKEATQRQPAKVVAAFGDPVFASNYSQPNDTTGGEQTAAMQTMENAPWQNVLRDIELNGDSFDPSVIKPLFYAKRELANLREAANDESFIASGFSATREQLLKTDLTQYAILHFATHGLLDPKRPEHSGLVLSTVDRNGKVQNGFVGLQDIYGLRAPVDLVVLSACQTALGKDVRGEGLLGLTRGFMYAGASSVMASLWKVDDEATAELMRQTYTNMLQKGLTPAAALRAAQNSLRQKPEWQAPYYWAGFTLQGKYRQVIKPLAAIKPASSYRILLLIGAILFLTGGALWVRHRRRRTKQGE